MNKLLILLSALVLFSGCVTKEIEVAHKLAIFEPMKCDGVKRMKIGFTVTIGNDVDLMITKKMLGDNSLVILPFPSSRMVFNEDVFLYTKSEIVKFIKCYVYNQDANLKNIKVMKDNNSKASKK